MLQTLLAAGFDCAPFAYAEGSHELRVEGAVCREGVPNEGAMLFTHTDRAQVEALLADYTRQRSESGMDAAFVSGPNWSVICEVEYCPAFQEALGGEFVLREAERGQSALDDGGGSELGSIPADWQTIERPEVGFAWSLPSDWIGGMNTDSGRLPPDVTHGETWGNPSKTALASVMVRPIAPYMEEFDAFVEGYSEVFESSGGRLITSYQTTVDGHPAMYLEGMGRVGGDNHYETSSVMIVLHSGEGHVIMTRTKDPALYDETLRMIVSSYTFVDATAQD